MRGIEVLDDERVSPLGKLLFVALCKYTNKDNQCYPSIRTLMKITGTTNQTVQRKLKELIECGWVIKRKGQKKNNLYQLTYPQIGGNEGMMMAQKRIMSLKIIDTDKFWKMSLTARYLYYELSMRADDDGFIGSPMRIVHSIGCSEADLVMLMERDFVIPFKSGVCVITDWLVNNEIKKDRYHPTIN